MVGGGHNRNITARYALKEVLDETLVDLPEQVLHRPILDHRPFDGDRILIVQRPRAAGARGEKLFEGFV